MIWPISSLKECLFFNMNPAKVLPVQTQQTEQNWNMFTVKGTLMQTWKSPYMF